MSLITKVIFMLINCYFMILIPVMLGRDIMKFILIGFGISINFFIVLMLIQNPFSKKKIFFSIISEIFYIFYIILSAGMVQIKVNSGNLFLKIDFSFLYLFAIMIPVLFLLRNLYNYVIRRKELLYRILVLKAIFSENNLTSKAQIKKYILKNYYLIPQRKKYFLINLDNIIKDLQQKPKLITKKGNKYRLTQKGQQFTNFFKNEFNFEYRTNVTKKHQEVWTEQELLKHATHKKKY